MYELVLRYDNGETDVYEYETREIAESMEECYTEIEWDRLVWTCVRKKKEEGK